MVVKSVLGSGVGGVSNFGRLLNFGIVMRGIRKGLREGSITGVVELLRWFPQLGIDVLGLFDGSAMGLVKRECLRLVKSGNLEEAVEVTEALSGFQFPIRGLIKPSDMIRVCVDERHPILAVRYASLLPPADILFCTIIREFGKRRDLVSALKAFEASKRRMNGHNMYAYRTIIDACGLCGDCFRSRSIFEDLLVQKVTPNIYVFNSLMNVNARDLTYIMDVYKQMQSLGVEADMTSYNILLKACCLSGRVDLAQGIYTEIQRLDSIGALKMDVFTYSTIIKVFADAKLWNMAIKIKEDMLSAGVKPNTVTWSALISACANAGLVDQATQLFDEMLIAGCEPNSQCFNTLLHACVEACQYDRAFRLFNTWKSGGSAGAAENSGHDRDANLSVEPTDADESCSTSTPHCTIASHQLRFARSVPFRPCTATYNILLKACGADLFRAQALIDEMRKLGLSPNHISWSILMNICGRAGNVQGALQILKSMSHSRIRPDVIAYTTAIKVCVENKNLGSAFSLFAEMKKFRIKPNLVTYNTLLRARSEYGSLQEVQQCLAIYQEMRKAGYKANDYYLKLLIEEWCEGIVQNSNQEGLSDSRNMADIRGLRGLLLERLATHLQKNASESLAVDIQGLTEVEARLVVLGVLRMIKENHNSGHPVRDDLLIILGITTLGEECLVKNAITKLLKKELGLEVTTIQPGGIADRKISEESAANTALNSKSNFGSTEFPTGFSAPTRRPATLQRLWVTKESLHHWLYKKLGTNSNCT